MSFNKQMNKTYHVCCRCLRDAVQNEINRGATEDQAAAIKLPQYEQMQGYKSQREVAVRRTYREITGTLK